MIYDSWKLIRMTEQHNIVKPAAIQAKLECHADSGPRQKGVAPRAEKQRKVKKKQSVQELCVRRELSDFLTGCGVHITLVFCLFLTNLASLEVKC